MRRLVLTAAVLFSAVPIQSAESTARNSNAMAALEAVCGSCHTVEFVIERKRTKEQWIRIVQKMVELGATGTDKQFAYVGRYLLTRLTLVRINDAPAGDLAMLLNIPGPVAEAIVAERTRQAFRTPEELLRVPGLDASQVEAFGDRIVF